MATQLVKYYTKTSYSKWTVRKTQIQDDTYGIDGKSIPSTSTRLGCIINEKLFLNNDLLSELDLGVSLTRNYF